MEGWVDVSTQEMQKTETALMLYTTPVKNTTKQIIMPTIGLDGNIFNESFQETLMSCVNDFGPEDEYSLFIIILHKQKPEKYLITVIFIKEPADSIDKVCKKKTIKTQSFSCVYFVKSNILKLYEPTEKEKLVRKMTLKELIINTFLKETKSEITYNKEHKELTFFVKSPSDRTGKINTEYEYEQLLPCVVMEKLDGMRIIIIADYEIGSDETIRVRVFSKNGLKIESFDQCLLAVEMFSDVIAVPFAIECEAIIPATNAAVIAGKVKSGFTKDVVLYIFNWEPLSTDHLYEFKDRFDLMETIINESEISEIMLVPTYKLEGFTHFSEMYEYEKIHNGLFEGFVFRSLAEHRHMNTGLYKVKVKRHMYMIVTKLIPTANSEVFKAECKSTSDESYTAVASVYPSKPIIDLLKSAKNLDDVIEKTLFSEPVLVQYLGITDDKKLKSAVIKTGK